MRRDGSDNLGGAARGGEERPRSVVWTRFKRHKLGLAGGAIIALFYLVALLAPFLAPYDFQSQVSTYTYAPPTRLVFRDAEGRWGLRPHVLGITKSRDPVTMELKFAPDPSRRYPVYFVVRGEPYVVIGRLKATLHLFGLDRSAEARVCLLGSDRFGRDMLSRILVGSRVSLTVGVFGILLSLVIGTFAGGVSGYYGGLVDDLLQRFIELLRSFPRIPLWLALSMVLPPRWSSVKVYFGVVTILSLIDWTGVARVVRGQFLSMKQREFVEAARAMGARDLRVIFRHILPNIASFIIVSASLSFPGMIIGETSISFLGLGIKEPMTSWGLLLKDAQAMEVLAGYPWMLVPGVFVVVSVLAFNFLGDAIRDAFDPYAVTGTRMPTGRKGRAESLAVRKKAVEGGDPGDSAAVDRAGGDVRVPRPVALGKP